MKEWIAEKIEEALRNYADGVKERAIENIEVFWVYFTEALADLSYTVSLYGGAGLIIAKVCGSTRATKYFVGIQVLNVFIQGMIL